jgi:hypothetical protein
MQTRHVWCWQKSGGQPDSRPGVFIFIFIFIYFSLNQTSCVGTINMQTLWQNELMARHWNYLQGMGMGSGWEALCSVPLFLALTRLDLT